MKAQLRTGARPAAGAKQQHPEIMALHVDILLQEPIRPELRRLLPCLRIARDSPDVDYHGGAPGDVVAGDLGLVGEHERGRGVKPQGFLDDALQVREAGEVGFVDDAFVSYDSIQFILDSLLHSWVPHDLRHGPFHSCCDHVLFIK